MNVTRLITKESVACDMPFIRQFKLEKKKIFVKAKNPTYFCAGGV